MFHNIQAQTRILHRLTEEGHKIDEARLPIACFGVVVMLAWRQGAFALIGGCLSRKYRITITKRPAQLPADR
jgi:hypothetical protein